MEPGPDKVRATSLPNIPVSPKRMKLTSVPRLPDERMTKKELKIVLDSELHNKRNVRVAGLIEHTFTNKVIPFDVDYKLEDALQKNWAMRPQMLKNKHEAQVQAANLKLEGKKNDFTPEDLMATFFNSLGKAMVTHAHSQGKSSVTKKYRQWSGAFSNIPLPGDTDVSKPDLILTEHKERTKSIESWAGVRCVCEFTTQDGFPSRTTDSLLARAVVLFRQQPSRRFVLGLILSEYEFSFTVFDRSGIWESPRYIINDNLLLFYRVLAGLMFSPLACIGFDPNVHYKNNIPSHIKIGTNQYTVLDIVFIAHGIVGQGTICYVVCKDNMYYVIKEFWADPNRAFDERDYLKHLADRHVENVSTFIEGGPVYVRSPYDLRSYEIDETNSFRPGAFIPKTAHTGPYHDRVRYRLVLSPIGRPITTFRSKEELIRAFMDIIAAHKRAYDAGILHRDLSLYNILLRELVFLPKKKKRERLGNDNQKEKTASPSPDAENATSGPSRNTRSSTSSASRPLSANTSDAASPTPASSSHPEERRKGLLIDFGYACFTEKYMNEQILNDPNFLDKIIKDDAHRSRTGTVPFMSIGVLLDYDTNTGSAGHSHDFNDDLESIFYILVWICVHYEGPGKPRKASSKKEKEEQEFKDPTAVWFGEGTYAEIAMAKSGSMDHFAYWLQQVLPPYFKDMYNTLIRMFAVLWPAGKGSDKPGQSRFVKNYATYEAILGALSPALRGEISESGEPAAATLPVDYNSFLSTRLQELKLNSFSTGYTSFGASISSESKATASVPKKRSSGK